MRRHLGPCLSGKKMAPALAVEPGRDYNEEKSGEGGNFMQHEITERIPLLDERGNLTQPGYARRLLPVYDRTKVRGGATRLKQWDYYYVGNDR